METQNGFDFTALFATPLFVLGGRSFTFGEVVLAALALLTLFVLLWTMLSWRTAKRRAANEAAALERAREAEARMAELVATQNELTGRLTAMNENLASRQSDLARTVNERLESMTGRIGQSITETTKNTQESLTKLQERLAVIDTAQTNITALTGQVVELQAILANKQTRGAFGEARMQAIVEDGLPQGAYAFQPTLSNGSRPDAIIHMPNDTPPLVIDAKFPLESYHAIRDAETPERAKIAAQSFRRDVETHLKAIHSKYFIKGETQDTAFMFVPSESIFAEIHEKHETLVQKAHRARVVIVSPSLLMLSIQVIQSVLKDHRMREQAHLIQGEVARLMEDVGRLDERVRKLATHFGQAQKDVDEILTSSGKVSKRGTRIIDLEFDEAKAVESGKRDGAKTSSRRGLKVVE
ncbi:DNA recombination protein RmuC [Salaquimonas pukyongi]|uniref:DNA recombination protein RmuC n=1 Tax=Salaquimonas pukyongi TaxID=2712698 RepID=UPI00096BA7C3|nr:DNA recombination protein RmuC [Salaquimonas pukyongi]